MKQIIIGHRIITKEDIKRIILNILFIIIIILLALYSPKPPEVEVTHIDYTQKGEMITIKVNDDYIDYYYEF